VILGKTTKHEILVQERFRLLQQHRTATGLIVQLPEFLMTPIRVDIPVVANGFVYLLVSLRDKSFQTCFIGETTNNLLEELGRHNSGVKSLLTSKSQFRPWSMAAFVINFSCEEDRVNLRMEMEKVIFLQLRIDTLMDHLQKVCASGEFGNLEFFKCGQLTYITK